MSRLPFIDWARGLAVVAMVVWHTADAWIKPALRVGEGWIFLRFFGGLAAPSFLFLAGVSAALSAKPQPTHEARDRALRSAVGRGLEVVLFGYLLRFQTWMIDAAEIRKLGHAHVWLPIGLGYALLVWSVNQLGPRPRRALGLALLGAILCVAGFVQVDGVAPGRLARLLQVDVLQAIGMSLVLLALLERATGLLQRPWLLALLGVAVAATTVPLGELLPGVIPAPIAAYFGKWPSPQGVPPAALFPLFPWFSYACLGASVGVLFRRHRADPGAVMLWLASAGAAAALVTSESYAFVANLHAVQPWLVTVTRVAYRVGIVLVLLLLGYVWTGHQVTGSPTAAQSPRTGGPRGRLLVRFGNASLRVYWVHLIFAYGLLGRPLQKNASYLAWGFWVSALLVAMWLLTYIGRRDHPKPAAPSGGTAAEAR